MAYEPIYDSITAEYRKKLAPVQTVVDNRMAAEGGVQIAKILSISTSVEIETVEAMDKEARFSGKIMYKALFTDSEGINRCMHSSAPVSDRFSDPCITPQIKILPFASVMDTDTVSVTPTEIRVATVVSAGGYALISEPLDFLTSAGDDVYVQTEDINYSAFSGKGHDEWEISEEFEPKIKMEKMLACEVQAVITDSRPGLDSILLEGKIAADISCQTENGLIKVINRQFTFMQEVSAMGARPGQKTDALVRTGEFDCTFEEGGEGGNDLLRLSLRLIADCFAFEEATTGAVVDAFSVQSELKITGEAVSLNKFCFFKCISERIEGTAVLDEGMPEVDNILGISALRLQITNAFGGDDRIKIEGVAAASVIYYNAENASKNSITVEFPYSLQVMCDGAREDYTVLAEGIILCAQGRIRRGNEVEISAEACFSVSVYEPCRVYAIKEIELGEERPPSKSAVAIYIARGKETLWDVAKALMTTPEIIALQNPGIKAPFEGGERILVYKQLKADFK